MNMLILWTIMLLLKFYGFSAWATPNEDVRRPSPLIVRPSASFDRLAQAEEPLCFSGCVTGRYAQKWCPVRNQFHYILYSQFRPVHTELCFTGTICVDRSTLAMIDSRLRLGELQTAADAFIAGATTGSSFDYRVNIRTGDCPFP